MPAAKGSKQKRGLARREEILTAAVDEIANNGFRRRGLKRLAERVGLSEAGLFHHFGTKNELLQAILAERHGQGIERFDRVFGGGGRQAIEALPAFMDETIAKPGLSKFSMVMLAESYEPDSYSHDHYAQNKERFRRDFADLVREAGKDCESQLEIDPDTASALAQAVLDGVQCLWILDPEGVDPVAVMQLCCDLLLTGLTPAGSSDSSSSEGKSEQVGDVGSI